LYDCREVELVARAGEAAQTQALEAMYSDPARDRVRNAEFLGIEPLRNFDDIVALGAEVRARGFKALKTNILLFDGEKLCNFQPGFGATAGFPALNVDRSVIESVKRQLLAFREGAGATTGLMLDTNFHFKTEGYIAMAQALEPIGLTWLEVDSYDPSALALIRQSSRCPVASCESLYGRRGYRPFLDAARPMLRLST